MKSFSAIMLLSVFTLTANGFGQTPLNQVFQDLHSSDAKIRDSAQHNIVQVLDKEWPNINADTALICSSLTDQDAYIRMQASAILGAIVQLYPQHNGVVVACTPQLVAAGKDTDEQTRINSLFALSHNANGAPAAAIPDFEAALTDPDPAVKMHGVIGIMRLSPGTGSASGKFLAERISSEHDAESQRALLAGVSASLKINPDVAHSAIRLIASPDPFVQSAAITATEVSSVDKSRALATLENYQGSAALSPQAKKK